MNLGLRSTTINSGEIIISVGWRRTRLSSHDHCNVKQGNKQFGLGGFVNDTLQQKKNNKLSQEQFDQLDKLGFVFDILQQQWDD